jgi:hypothetical protein
VIVITCCLVAALEPLQDMVWPVKICWVEQPSLSVTVSVAV